MRFEGTRAISRRAVAWDPIEGVLTVGERSVSLTCSAGDNDCILRTYLHLVTEQRDIPLDRSMALRRDDILVLAELLDLDDVRLERQLASILRLSAPEARELRRELLRQRVAVAAVGVGLAAALPLSVAAAAEEPAPAPSAAEPATAPVELTEAPTTTAITVVAPLAPPTTAAPTTAPPATVAVVAETPAEEPAEAPEVAETEIGYSVTYERDPDFVPPEGVEIGDAMVIERDLPSEG